MREISVKWNEATPLGFSAVAPGGQLVLMDSPVSGGGNGEGFSPKTLLLVALGGCTGMDVIGMLRKMRQDVTSYNLEIKGWEHEEYPKKFDRIIIEHIVTGHNLSREMVERAVQLSHEKYCGVSASLQGSVEIEVVTRLVEAE
jgi:putative redox protein